METRLGVVETRFADIVWQNAPLTTKKLVELCAQELNWKRTTTYTVLKKLCERGIFLTQDSNVTVLIPKEEFYSMQSEYFVEQNFHGSLPAFVAAFAKRKPLKPEEMAELKTLIDSMGE